MNIRELIVELMEFDMDLPVARDGMEGEHSGMHSIELVGHVCGQFDSIDGDNKTNVVLLS